MEMVKKKDEKGKGVSREVSRMDKIYSKMSLEELERRTKSVMRAQVVNFVEMMDILDHIRRLNRFRDDPVYKKATFEQYLKEVYGMTKTKFYMNRRIYMDYADKVIDYSPGFVEDVVKKIPRLKIPKAWKELEEFEKKKGRKATVEEKNRIMEKYIPAKEKKKPVPIDYRSRYMESQEIIVAMRKEIKDKDRQIEKLKAALRKYQDEKD